MDRTIQNAVTKNAVWLINIIAESGLEYTNKNARSRVFLWLQFGTTDRLEGKFYRYMTMKKFTFLSICVRNVSLIVLKQEQGWKYN